MTAEAEPAEPAEPPQAEAAETAPAEATEETQLDALVATNLHGLGSVRLRKFSDADLRSLLCLLAADCTPEAVNALDTDALVGALLAEKKRLDKQKKGKGKDDKLKTASALWHTLAVGLHKQCAALQYVHTQDTELPQPLQIPEQLKIVSFNALKLRLTDPAHYADGSARPTTKDGLLEDGLLLMQHWQALCSIMAGFDVIVMQEIPGNEKLREERIAIFLTMLSKGTAEGRSWTYVHSVPSGKAGGNKECHVAFVKSPLTVEKVQTWQSAGVAPAVLLDYAPLQVLLSDPDKPNFKICLTSVHLPPANPPERARQRDAQLGALLKNYWDHVRATFDLARTQKGAKDAGKSKAKEQVFHVIAGDFNVFPGKVDTDAEKTEVERFPLDKNDFVFTIPETAATSSGGKNYDNILIDKSTYQRYMPHGAVMRLVKQQKSSSGIVGLSDHFPVVLTVEFFEETK